MAKQKPKTMSLIQFNQKFYDNFEACRDFFFDTFHPVGFICPKCGCVHYRFLASRPTIYQCTRCSHQSSLFANTIFQDNKLNLYTLLLGVYLFFTAHNAISAEELANSLGVNCKTAQLLCRKLRYLMELDNDQLNLKSQFMEADAFYIGARSHNGKRGLGTEKQAFLIVLGTDKENHYPNKFKTKAIKSENKQIVQDFFKAHVDYTDTTYLKTDKDGAYNILNDELIHKGDIIDYKNDKETLHWTNTLISNIKSNIDGIFHGIKKQYLERYVHEYEWRFNHRYDGKNLTKSIKRILGYRTVMTRKMFKSHFATV